MSVVVLAEHRRGALAPVTAELVSAAVTLGRGPVRLLLVCAEPDALLDACALEGVDELLAARSPQPDLDPDAARAALAALLREQAPDAVLLAHSPDGIAIGPAVAAAAGAPLATDVVELAAGADGIAVARQGFGGKLLARAELPAGAVVTVRPGTFEPAGCGAVPPQVDLPAAPAGRVRQLGYDDPPSGGVDLSGAEVIVAIGRGIGERENVALFEQVAKRLGATLAASRPLVDAGWIEPDRQVGQSGATVSPRVYVAFGISGAPQHVAGIRRAGTLIAVNTDRDAPLLNVAEHALVGDAVAVARAIASA